MANDQALVAVSQYQSEINAIRAAPEPLAARWTLLTLAGFVTVAVGILFLAKVDRVISSSTGKVISSDATIVVQALDTSIIKSINVREGDRVKKGQLLATLDPTFAAADVTQLRQQLAALDAQIARAQAELKQRKPVFPESKDADSVHSVELQTLLYDQRAAQFRAQINSYDQKIAQTQATISKLANDAARMLEREKISKQIEGMRVTLAEKGAGSLLNQLTSTDTHLEVLRNLENTQNGLEEAKHQLSSLRADREAFAQQWSATTSQELVTAKTARDQAFGQYDKALRHKELVEIVASEDAIILTLAKLSVGSVLKGGDAIFTAAPLRSPVEAEVSVLSRDVGFLRAGDHASLKIDAFDYTQHGVVEGSVRWISEGAFSSDDNGQAVVPYYKVRISTDKYRLIDVPQSVRLIPGMTLTADMTVGHRTLASYLLGSVYRSTGEAMREP